MSDLDAWNQALFLRINGAPATPAWLIHSATGIAEDLIYLIPVLLLGFWLWGDTARRGVALKACLVTFGALALAQAIGAIWPHPRPFMLALGQLWMPHAPDPSFPSDHMTVFAGVALTLLLDGALWFGAAVLLLGVGVGWTRVFLGVHFPFDMLGGLGVAALAYALVTPVWRAMALPVTALLLKPYRLLLAKPIAFGWVRP